LKTINLLSFLENYRIIITIKIKSFIIAVIGFINIFFIDRISKGVGIEENALKTVN